MPRATRSHLDPRSQGARSARGGVLDLTRVMNPGGRVRSQARSGRTPDQCGAGCRNRTDDLRITSLAQRCSPTCSQVHLRRSARQVHLREHPWSEPNCNQNCNCDPRLRCGCSSLARGGLSDLGPSERLRFSNLRGTPDAHCVSWDVRGPGTRGPVKRSSPRSVGRACIAAHVAVATDVPDSHTLIAAADVTPAVDDAT